MIEMLACAFRLMLHESDLWATPTVRYSYTAVVSAVTSEWLNVKLLLLL